jgi:hypothetical protein
MSEDALGRTLDQIKQYQEQTCNELQRHSALSEASLAKLAELRELNTGILQAQLENLTLLNASIAANTGRFTTMIDRLTEISTKLSTTNELLQAILDEPPNP